MDREPHEQAEPDEQAGITEEVEQAREVEPERRVEGPARVVSAKTELSWGLALFLLLAILVVVFTVQNTQPVGLEFLAWEGRFPMALIIIVVVAVTVILDEILGLILRRRRRRRAAERAELERFRRELG